MVQVFAGSADQFSSYDIYMMFSENIIYILRILYVIQRILYVKILFLWFFFSTSDYNLLYTDLFLGSELCLNGTSHHTLSTYCVRCTLGHFQ